MRQILAIVTKDAKEMLRNMVLITSVIVPVLLGLLSSSLVATPSHTVGVVGMLPQSLAFIEEYEFIEVRVLAEDANPESYVSRDMPIVIEAENDFDAKLVAPSVCPDLKIYGEKGHFLTSLMLSTLASKYESIKPNLPMSVKVYNIEKQARELSYEQLMLLTVILFGLTLTGTYIVPTLLILEKEYGTLKAVVASATPYSTVIVSKGIIGFVLTLTITLITLIASRSIGSISYGFVLALITGAVLYTLLGLLIGAMFESVAKLNGLSTVIMLVLLLPVLMLPNIMTTSPPQWILGITKIVPSYWLLQLLEDVMLDQTLKQLFIPSAVVAFTLLGISACLYFVFRRQAAENRQI